MTIIRPPFFSFGEKWTRGGMVHTTTAAHNTMMMMMTYKRRGQTYQIQCCNQIEEGRYIVNSTCFWNFLWNLYGIGDTYPSLYYYPDDYRTSSSFLLFGVKKRRYISGGWAESCGSFKRNSILLLLYIFGCAAAKTQRGAIASVWAIVNEWEMEGRAEKSSRGVMKMSPFIIRQQLLNGISLSIRIRPDEKDRFQQAQEKGEKPSSNFIQTNIYISIKEGRQDEDAGVNIPRFFWGTRASPLSFFLPVNDNLRAHLPPFSPLLTHICLKQKGERS